MRVLIACEFSQVVCKAFRDKGHEAYSCDILPTEGNHEWHIQDDVLKHLDDGWDLMIAHPPCTYLATSGARWLYDKRYPNRKRDQELAVKFFMDLYNAPIGKVAVENPVGIISSVFRKPDQIIHPYYFGDKAQKATCLWLKNLNPLFHLDKPDLFGNKVTHTDKGKMHITKSGKVIPEWYSLLAVNENRAKERSRFFPGIAKAMATQWG